MHSLWRCPLKTTPAYHSFMKHGPPLWFAIGYHQFVNMELWCLYFVFATVLKLILPNLAFAAKQYWNPWWPIVWWFPPMLQYSNPGTWSNQPWVSKGLFYLVHVRHFDVSWLVLSSTGWFVSLLDTVVGFHYYCNARHQVYVFPI
jgi:hypothetical protein